MSAHLQPQRVIQPSTASRTATNMQQPQAAGFGNVAAPAKTRLGEAMSSQPMERRFFSPPLRPRTCRRPPQQL